MSHAFNEVLLKLKALGLQERQVEGLTAHFRAGEPTFVHTTGWGNFLNPETLNRRFSIVEDVEPPTLDLDAMAAAAMVRLRGHIDFATRYAQVQTTIDFALARSRCLPHRFDSGILLAAIPFVGPLRWIDPRRTA